MYRQVYRHNLLVNQNRLLWLKALEILGLDKSEVAMVGDLYDTDIMSGINVGMDTIHVQTGVSTLEDAK